MAVHKGVGHYGAPISPEHAPPQPPGPGATSRKARAGDRDRGGGRLAAVATTHCSTCGQSTATGIANQPDDSAIIVLGAGPGEATVAELPARLAPRRCFPPPTLRERRHRASGRTAAQPGSPRRVIARSLAMRCTVPVPMPSDLATFKIPTPFASLQGRPPKAGA